MLEQTKVTLLQALLQGHHTNSTTNRARNTLQVTSGTCFTGQMTQPTVSKY